MAYKSRTYSIDSSFLSQALHWANAKVYCAFFNPTIQAKYPHGTFQKFIGTGSKSVENLRTFEDLDQLQSTSDDWLIGHLTYDLKNQIENLESCNPAFIEYPLLNFFAAEDLLFFDDEQVTILSKSNPEAVHSAILEFEKPEPVQTPVPEIRLNTQEEMYIENVRKIINHIIDGDIYEMNYCIDYTLDQLTLEPVDTYFKLLERSPTPFSVYYKIKDLYALGASPERFIKKTGDQIISQPIKGTAKRGKNQEEDQLLIQALRNDEKELAENMMIVDLVRNDLAKSAQSGSVSVEEMFGIYSFKHWHQMISTVTARLKPDITIGTILKNAFPMGSMTGAPKVKVMELIDRYETFKRGLYSGSIGYITPDGDFDFNVVIRTLLYDQKNKKGQLMVGSAITFDSIPKSEFHECLLKARPVLETLGITTQINH